MSSGKRFIGKKQIVQGGDMSQATVTSTIMNIQGVDNIGVQVNLLTGTPTGTFDIKVSADHVENGTTVMTAGTFIALGSPYTVAMTSGSPTNIYFDISEISAPYIELVYTKTSGTGTFDAFITGKAV